jgi:hypothetical protein
VLLNLSLTYITLQLDAFYAVWADNLGTAKLPGYFPWKEEPDSLITWQSVQDTVKELELEGKYGPVIGFINIFEVETKQKFAEFKKHILESKWDASDPQVNVVLATMLVDECARSVSLFASLCSFFRLLVVTLATAWQAPLIALQSLWMQFSIFSKLPCDYISIAL